MIALLRWYWNEDCLEVVGQQCSLFQPLGMIAVLFAWMLRSTIPTNGQVHRDWPELEVIALLVARRSEAEQRSCGLGQVCLENA